MDMKTAAETATTGRSRGIPTRTMMAALASHREWWENSLLICRPNSVPWGQVEIRASLSLPASRTCCKERQCWMSLVTSCLSACVPALMLSPSPLAVLTMVSCRLQSKCQAGNNSGVDTVTR